MSDGTAWRCLGLGIAGVLFGIALLHSSDPFLLPLWGTTLTLVGGVAAALGAGVLLRMWR